MSGRAQQHAFVERPHRTLLVLSAPVLIGFLAGPITDLVDTRFSALLGASEQAALGVGALVFMSVNWVFNFLGIAGQTEVARALGRGDRERACALASLALAWSLACGAALGVTGWFASESLAAFLNAEGAVLDHAVTYLHIRWLSMPAIILVATSAGVLRGMQDMRGPMLVSIGLNLLNVVGDAALVLGVGPIPGLGVAGLAWATVAAQWTGAWWSLSLVGRRLGWSGGFTWAESGRFFRVGADQFARTALLMAFMWAATGLANDLGESEGAAHQAVRAFWLTAALLLDSVGITAQSLIGYFLGGDNRPMARRVAAVSCGWGLLGGFLICGLMFALEPWVLRELVAPQARAAAVPAWRLAALMQPVAALCFVTDGIHWGTRDFAWLRNGMIFATALGWGLLRLIDREDPDAFEHLWGVVVLWLVVRAVFGVARIWPGVGAAPLQRRLPPSGAPAE